MNSRSKDLATRLLEFATVTAICAVILMLWGAGLFRVHGHFLGLDNLEHVGAFIGGVFTPLAVGWAARTFLLQRQQMLETLDEMREQNSLQREALKQANEQILRDREKQKEISDPLLQITSNGSLSGWQGATYKFKIRNHGATAKRLQVSYEIKNSANGVPIKKGPSLIPMPLPAEGDRDFEIFIPPENRIDSGSFEVSVDILAERLDGLVSRFTFTAKDKMEFISSKTERAVEGLSIS